MNTPTPPNELDQAILALAKSKAALPDFCRCLRKGELFLLMRYQPDLVDATIELKNGAPFPFSLLKTDKGLTVPAYTSEERASEGLANGKVPSRQFVIGSMPALQALEVIGKMKFSMTLNRGCRTGEVCLPADLLRDLADGTALKPQPPSGKLASATLKIVEPAEYPTDVVQASFEFFRRHDPFKAAWILTQIDKPDDYFIILLMQPRDASLYHDFTMVAQAASGKLHQVHVQPVDENNPEHVKAFYNCGQPFYQAVDYQPPASANATGQSSL